MMTDKQKRSVRDMRRAGLTYSEIAGFTGLPANTVKSFCFREGICAADAPGNGSRDVCKYCGKPLEHHPGRKKKLFCDDKCRSDWWNGNRNWAGRKKARRLICLCCGAEFYSDGNKQRKYCGRDCYIRSRHGEGLP
jgi:hypothetical protein